MPMYRGAAEPQNPHPGPLPKGEGREWKTVLDDVAGELADRCEVALQLIAGGAGLGDATRLRQPANGNNRPVAERRQIGEGRSVERFGPDELRPRLERELADGIG